MRYKIGCSLSFSTFTNEPTECSRQLCESFGGKEKLFEYCAENLDTVELRMVKHGFDQLEVLNAVKQLNAHGITVTIHGEIGEVEEFFSPYLLLFDAALQDCYNITVHPAKNEADTVRMLKSICRRIDEKGYPVRITLENQRIKHGNEFGICGDIVKIVDNVASAHLGICYDFGHQLSNARLHGKDEVCRGFISGVRHTHIHSFYDGRTHFPLDCGEALLEKNLSALFESGFDRVLSLELEPERYSERFDIKTALENSVSVLKIAAMQTEKKMTKTAHYKSGYTAQMKQLFERFESADNCIGLIGHSGYIIKIGSKKIAVDYAPCVLPVDDESITYVLEKLSSFDAYILTHAHCDHYDPAVLSSLPECIIKFVPDFMYKQIENAFKTSNGYEFLLGELKVVFFESGHTLGSSVVPEYGFYIEHKGKKYLFPTDVRDYSFKYPSFDDVRVLFAHMWLGKGQALNLHNNEYVEKFCRFVNSFKAKQVYLSHLYDVHRTIDEMWSEVHFDAIKDKLGNAVTFSVGDLITF